MNKLILALVSIISPIFFYAQQTKVEQSGTSYNGKLRAAIHVVIEPSSKDVAKAWKAYVSDKLGQKLKGGNDDQKAEAVNIPQLSDQMVNLYSKVEDNIPSGTSMYVFLGKGEDSFFNPTDDDATFNKLEAVVKDFLSSYLPAYYNGMIETSTKTIEGTQKTLSSVTKSVDQSTESIQNNDEKIKELEEENAKLKSELVESTTKKTEQEKALKEQTDLLKEQKSRYEATKSVLMN